MVALIGCHLQVIFALTLLSVIDKSSSQNYKYADEEFNAISLSANTRKITGRRQTYTYTFSPSSTRNFNSGARFYLRYVPKATQSSQTGYSFYRHNMYYASSYGYRLKSAPAAYRTVPMGPTWVYYPPMFQYYHFGRSWYWKGQTARYVCRNELAYWPLENQTHVFVDGLGPALNLSDFDANIPDPPNNDWIYNLPLPRPQNDSALIELNSMEINLNGREASSRLFKPRSAVVPAAAVARAGISLTVSEVKIYAYFACPDGKDPDEIYCCGPSNAQYCCLDTNEEKFVPTVLPSLPTKTVIAIIGASASAVFCAFLVVYRCCKSNKCCDSSNDDRTDANSTRSAQSDYVPANANDTDPTNGNVGAPVPTPAPYSSSYLQAYPTSSTGPYSTASMSSVPVYPSPGLTLSNNGNSSPRRSSPAVARATAESHSNMNVNVPLTTIVSSGGSDAGGLATSSVGLQPQAPAFDTTTTQPAYSSLLSSTGYKSAISDLGTGPSSMPAPGAAALSGSSVISSIPHVSALSDITQFKSSFGDYSYTPAVSSIPSSSRGTNAPFS